MDVIIDQALAHIRELMSKRDAFYDFAHIQRVLDFAKIIQQSDEASPDAGHIDTNVVSLVAILHHLGDADYLRPGEDSNTVIENFLTFLGCPSQVAKKVQYICSRISYNHELQNPDDIAQLCSFIPEFAIVQDADRLDALGATGVARAFHSNAAVLEDGTFSIEYFRTNLLPLEGKMKTATGKVLAKELTIRLKLFMGWLGAEEKLRHGTDDKTQPKSDAISASRPAIGA